ncbi:recombinase family protein [Dongia deserti]|uniref:recombinase family protein n=1 Tax=Dongia deserti TaxID=2268030 RepID=UPI0038996587
MTDRAPIVAAYARYSTLGQKEASIEDQLRNCRAHADRQGWAISRVFEDRGISGTVTDRPGYQAMLAAARAARFDVLIVDDLSRLSRDKIEFGRLIRELKSRGIRVIGVSDGFDSLAESADVQEGVRGIINSVFIKDLAKKTHRGLMGKALKGENTGGRTYGYRTIIEEDPVRKDADGRPLITARRLAINDEQARWVRQIFTWYADGWSPQMIARKLNELGVRTARGGSWSHTAIYAAEGKVGFLNNEIYIGKRRWNRATFDEVYDDPRNPDRFKLVRREKSESEWVVNDAPELRIVDQELWDKVKARQQQTYDAGRKIKEALHARARVGGGPKHLFSGVLKCGVCGENYVAISNGKYACSNHRNHAGCSNGLRVKRDLLERRLLYTLRHDLFTQEHLSGFAERAKRLAADQKRERRKAELIRKTRLIEVEKEIGNILAALRQGIITGSTKAELERLESERDQLQRVSNAGMTMETVVEALPSLVERYRRKLAGVEDFDADDIPALRQLIASVTGGEIKLHPSANGYLRAEVRGHYIGLYKDWEMWDETLWSTVGGPVSGFGWWSKNVVAGRGFEPLTFRL